MKHVCGNFWGASVSTMIDSHDFSKKIKPTATRHENFRLMSEVKFLSPKAICHEFIRLQHRIILTRLFCVFLLFKLLSFIPVLAKNGFVEFQMFIGLYLTACLFYQVCLFQSLTWRVPVTKPITTDGPAILGCTWCRMDGALTVSRPFLAFQNGSKLMERPMGDVRMWY